MPTELLTRHEGTTLVLTLSDPATRNALSREVYAVGAAQLDRAAADPNVRCIVLHGAGETFCAGGNLQRILQVRAQGDAQGRAFQRESIDRLGQWILALQACPKPVIAAVEGFAAGAGASLALACDLLVMARDAKLVMSYGKVGFSPDGGGSWFLARQLPRPLALKALWQAEALDAGLLDHHGLVHTLSEPGSALAEALRVAESLARMAPNVVASVKRLVDQAPCQPLPQHLAAERDAFVDNLFHANGLEGPSAFLEKRRPAFGPVAPAAPV